MTAFAIFATALAAAALAWLLWPLRSRRARGVSRTELSLSVHRDQLRELDADLAAGTLAQADYDRARMEIERRALEEAQEEGRRAPAAALPRKRALALVAGLPVLALAVYVVVGNVRGLDPQQRQAQGIGAREIEAMVERLAARLQQNPEDVEGWRMLGRSYGVMGRYAEAANAYARAAARAPRDADLLAELADSLAMARGQNLQGEPEELVLRALQIDPTNLRALALAGTAAFTREDYRAAARHWEAMLPALPAGSEDARSVRANIDEAKARAAQKKAPAKKAATAGLSGTVGLSPKLAGQASPDDTVFIFARAVDGPPMPLAALRRKVRELPVRFTLDDSMAMTPAAKLSGHPKVVVVARVSKSGNATAQKGDLQGTSAPVANDARGVVLTIDSIVP